MFARARHPSSSEDQLVEVVSIDRGKKTANIRSTDPLTKLAMLKAGRASETTAVPTAWLAWIPCGP